MLLEHGESYKQFDGVVKFTLIRITNTEKTLLSDISDYIMLSVKALQAMAAGPDSAQNMVLFSFQRILNAHSAAQYTNARAIAVLDSWLSQEGASRQIFKL